jgi:hypothetical protein
MQQIQMAAPPHMALAYQLSGMSLAGPPHMGAAGGAPQAIALPPQPLIGAPPMLSALPSYAPAGLPQAAGGGQAPVMVIGTDSKTIKIRGLPFRATPLDIFNFFEGCARAKAFGRVAARARLWRLPCAARCPRAPARPA